MKALLMTTVAVLIAGSVWAAEPEKAPEAKQVTPSGLTIIDQGGTGEGAVKNGDMVFVHYRGTLENGKEFDSSYSRNQPFRVQKVGAGHVIKGWDEGLLGMTVGQKRRLIVPAALAYGEKAQGDIPANSTLIFEIQLIGLVRLPEGK